MIEPATFLHTPSPDYVMSQREAHKYDEPKVFDWIKAAKIIKEKKAMNAEAGLIEDWFWTGGSILNDGAFVLENDNVYLSSLWATPVICIDGQFEECWIRESKAHGWGSGTMWPPEALAIMEGKDDINNVDQTDELH